MIKKIIAVLMVTVFTVTAASCSVMSRNEESTDKISEEEYVAVSGVGEEEEISGSITEREEESTTEPTTELTTENTTEAESEKTATTKIKATTKKISTTVAKVVKTTTKAVGTVKSFEGETSTKIDNTSTELKYGVIRLRSTTYYYGVNADGSKTELGSEVDAETYNRVFYSADYDTLLPAAKANRKTYKDMINSVLELTNAMRAEKGLTPLKLDDKLTEQANVRAEEIAWSGVHSHTRPGGKYFSSIFKENGYSSGTVGENIGWGYEDAASVCQAWKDSETHYENIMSTDYVSIGIGVAQDADPSANYVWVQHFYSN